MWTPLLLSVGLAGLADRRSDCPRKTTLDQLDREVLACQQRLSEAEEAARSCDSGGPPPAIYTELLQAFADTEVEVVRDGPRVVASIPISLLYAPESLEVRKEARLVVDLLATALNLHPELSAWLLAHTDDTPLSRGLVRAHGDAVGWTHAQARALAKVLTTDFSVEPARLTAVGHGTARPRAASETDGARQKNRRIDVVIGPSEQWR